MHMRSHYIKYMLLGEGMYGEVWSCIRVADNKDGFAVKFLEKRCVCTIAVV